MKQITNLIDRSHGLLAKDSTLEHLFTFKDFPVFFGCTDQPIENDYVTDMIWGIEPSTGLIQLTKLVPLDILYMEQHVDAIGKTWDEYYDAFTNYIIKHKKGSILEIGGGSGKLANNILAKDAYLKYIVVEPHPIFEESERLKVIRDFFTKDTIIKIKGIETVVFSQVLEHAYDPESFLANIYNYLPAHGKLIFAYPNLENWFSNKYTNAINFEHTFLLTDYFLDFILQKLGFAIIEKVAYKNHSHFYLVEKGVANKSVNINKLKGKYNYYKKMFRDYISYHQVLIEELNNKVKQTDSNIYLFGAHIFSQFLLAFGLNQKGIKSILDNSPLKQGKRLYGTALMVNSPQILKDLKSPVVILKAGVYNNEIKEDIVNNINPNVIFWE